LLEYAQQGYSEKYTLKLNGTKMSLLNLSCSKCTNSTFELFFNISVIKKNTEKLGRVASLDYYCARNGERLKDERERERELS
jgi:putative hemolysin